MKYIISLNCGTSSVKYAVFEKDSLRERSRGAVERVAIGGTFIRHNLAGKEEALLVKKDCANHGEAIDLVFSALKGTLDPEYKVLNDISDAAAVGHRVLHGGDKFTKSVIINEEVKDVIKEMFVFGPLHNPANLAGIKAVSKLAPEMPQIAVFDTAFFQTLPEKAYLYGSPYEWYKKYKIRKYGFHGTSHLYLTKRAAAFLGKSPKNINLVTLHIGNGISLTAIKNGAAVEHSMGATPLDGVMMGTRSGSVDPAIVPFIIDKENKTAHEVIEQDLNRKSGLLGFCGLTDLRDLMKKMDEGDEDSVRAFDSYCYKIRSFLAAYLGVLNYEADAIVFAGGVGENNARTRETICSGFEKAGLVLDKTKNEATMGNSGETDISASGSAVKILMLPTNEEQVLLEDVVALLNGSYDVHTNFKYSFEDRNWK